MLILLVSIDATPQRFIVSEIHSPAKRRNRCGSASAQQTDSASRDSYHVCKQIPQSRQQHRQRNDLPASCNNRTHQLDVLRDNDQEGLATQLYAQVVAATSRGHALID